MKVIWLMFILLFSLTGTLAWCQSQEQNRSIEGVAAIVGDKIILKSEVAQYLNMSMMQQGLDPRKDLDKIREMESGVITSLIDQKVILELAVLDSIEVEEKNVDRALDQRIEGFIAQMGSEEAVEKALGQSLRSYRREFWYDMQDYLISDTYRQQLISNISVTRDDVVDFFEAYRDSLPSFPAMAKIRHILTKIEPNEAAINETVSQLKDIKQKILKGGSFAEMAEKFSQDPGSSKTGGSLGFVRRGNLVTEFESTAFTLSPGEISDPVKTIFGFHIIETEEILGDKIKVRHILLTPQVTEEDDSRAYRFSASLKDSILSLDDFIRIADSHSQDEQTRETGGSLGWIDPARFPVQEIGLAIEQVGLETCGGPVFSNLGYHLIWVEALRPGGPPSLSSHWSEIEAMALNHKKSEWFQNWLANARQKVYIKVPG